MLFPPLSIGVIIGVEALPHGAGLADPFTEATGDVTGVALCKKENMKKIRWLVSDWITKHDRSTGSHVSVGDEMIKDCTVITGNFQTMKGIIVET